MAVTLPPKGGDEDYYLQDFICKFPLPQVVKITKGQIHNLGVPCPSNLSLSQMVLLAQVSKRLKVAAQPVKFKDGRMVPIGSKLAIPENYDGWFEILSENGRAVRCIETVCELLQKFPKKCLVRDNIKVHFAKTDCPETISDKSRTLCAGETLVLVSEVQITISKHKSPGRFLKCFTTNGETVFLNSEQKGKFSPIANEGNISGVHSVQNLLLKRFPLMVRLVHGKPPFGLKNSSQFSHEMRLYSLFEEESIMALPLQKELRLVALPPSTQLKVQVLQNTDSLKKSKNLHWFIEKGKSMVQDAFDKIQIFDISVSKELRIDRDQIKKRFKKPSRENKMKRRYSVPNSKNEKDENKEKPLNRSYSENDKEELHHSYDEIDQIYDYVRGLRPLPKNTMDSDKRCSKVETEVNNSLVYIPLANDSVSSITPSYKPEPPPIETIPAMQIVKHESQMINQENGKISPSSREFDTVDGHIYEKIRSRKNSFPRNTEILLNNHSKLFTSPPANQGVKKFMMQGPAQIRIHQKSKGNQPSPVHKESNLLDQRISNCTPRFISPLFNIRYKSLINISTVFDESEPKVSSYPETKNEWRTGEDKCNKLQRAKSLTDLFMGPENLCPCNYWERFSNGKGNKRNIFSNGNLNAKVLNGQHMKHFGFLYF